MRNWLLAATVATLLAAPLANAPQAAAQQSKGAQGKMSPTDAHAKAQAGEVVLIDIRTPEEWRETGVPVSAYAINMHDDPKVFAQRLTAATGGDKSRPIALICRTGNRSNALQAQLVRAGFTNVVDVSEGVVGGPNGKGWLKAGLPTRPGTMASTPPAAGAKASKP